MNTAGFYKNDDGFVLYGPHFVLGPYDSFQLYVESKDTYTYPVDGWYWFDSIEDAYTFFNLELPKDQNG